MMPRLDEQNRRIFAAAIANTLGHGGGKVVCDITGLSKPTLTKGRRECAELRICPEITWFHLNAFIRVRDGTIADEVHKND